MSFPIGPVIIDPTAVDWKQDPSQRNIDYPWHIWLDGQARILAPGRDWWGNVATFRSRLYRAAADNGVRARTRWDKQGRGLIVQALGHDGSPLGPLPPG